MQKKFWLCLSHKCGALTMSICVTVCRKCSGATKKLDDEDAPKWNLAKNEARRAYNNQQNIPRKGIY